MTDEALREKFEAWLISRGHFADTLATLRGTDYVMIPALKTLWECWQAASEIKATQPDEQMEAMTPSPASALFQELARAALDKHVNILWDECEACEQCVEDLAAGIRNELTPRLEQAARQIVDVVCPVLFAQDDRERRIAAALEILQDTVGK